MAQTVCILDPDGDRPRLAAIIADANCAQKHVWRAPSVGLSGLTQISNFHPAWNGDLLAATLKRGAALRLRIRDNRVVFVEPIELPSKRIRYILSDNRGSVVLWNDDSSLLILRPSAENYAGGRVDSIIASLNVSDRLARSLRTTMEGCEECHSVVAGEHVNAPNIGDVFERKIAGSSFRNYSTALRQTSGEWSEENLRLFISDPQGFAPGTTMPDPSIADPEVVNGGIAVLRDLASVCGRN